jgi:hypothetical protein
VLVDADGAVIVVGVAVAVVEALLPCPLIYTLTYEHHAMLPPLW